MAEGRARRQWDHTASLVATLANIPLLVWGKEPKFSAEQFHPYLKQRAAEPVERLNGKDGIRLLKAIYGNRPYGG
jgi:hypothetical protein